MLDHSRLSSDQTLPWLFLGILLSGHSQVCEKPHFSFAAKCWGGGSWEGGDIFWVYFTNFALCCSFSPHLFRALKSYRQRLWMRLIWRRLIIQNIYIYHKIYKYSAKYWLCSLKGMLSRVLIRNLPLGRLLMAQHTHMHTQHMHAHTVSLGDCLGSPDMSTPVPAVPLPSASHLPIEQGE